MSWTFSNTFFHFIANLAAAINKRTGSLVPVMRVIWFLDPGWSTIYENQINMTHKSNSLSRLATVIVSIPFFQWVLSLQFVQKWTSSPYIEFFKWYLIWIMNLTANAGGHTQLRSFASHRLSYFSNFLFYFLCSKIAI